jgi:hypothetical protein
MKDSYEVNITLNFYYLTHRWKRLQMGKGIVVIILGLFLSAPLRLESKLIVAACRDASVITWISYTYVSIIYSIRNPCVIRGIFRVRTLTNFESECNIPYSSHQLLRKASINI